MKKSIEQGFKILTLFAISAIFFTCCFLSTQNFASIRRTVFVSRVNKVSPASVNLNTQPTAAAKMYPASTCFNPKSSIDWMTWNGDGRWETVPSVNNTLRPQKCSWTHYQKSWGEWNLKNYETIFPKEIFKPHGCQLASLDAISFLELLRNKKLLFLGDSLSFNHVLYLWCSLENQLSSSHDTQLSEFEHRFIKGPGDAAQNQCRRLSYFNVTICYLRSNCFLHQIIREAVDMLQMNENDYIVTNTGAHESPCVKDKFNTDKKYCKGSSSQCLKDRVGLFVKSLDQKERQPFPKILWREYAARHFPTNTGEWCSPAQRNNCNYCSRAKQFASLNDSYTKQDSRGFQNNDALPLVRHANISILPIWRSTFLADPTYHPGSGDCTHYANPNMLDVWNDMLFSWLVFNPSPVIKYKE
jgi:hypothetical protein